MLLTLRLRWDKPNKLLKDGGKIVKKQLMKKCGSGREGELPYSSINILSDQGREQPLTITSII
jgi:hypothetical protein